jgi:uncharacterized protein DUF992
MFVSRSAALRATALAGALVCSVASAQAQTTQVGTLTCQVAGGIGLVITSQKEIACSFVNARRELEAYTGVIRRFGLDIGATTGGQLAWSVFAPNAVARGALAGSSRIRPQASALLFNLLDVRPFADQRDLPG